MDLFKYTDLLAAFLNLVLLVAIAVFVHRRSMWRSHVAIGVMVFFLLRVLSRLNDSPDVLFKEDPRLEAVLDVASVLVLLYLLTQVGRINRLLTAMLDEARYRSEEYARAKHHYTQVVRHRMFNPLTVIEGAAHTLKSGAVEDADVRGQLCDVILESTEELREVTLEPERRDALERDLDAVPRIDRTGEAPRVADRRHDDRRPG